MKKKVIILSLLLLISKLLDIYTTYLGSPTLANEFNPLVGHLKFGWLPIILKNIIILFLAIYMYYYYYIKYSNTIMKHNCNKLINYIGITYYDDYEISFKDLLYKSLKNKKPFIIHFLFSISRGLIIIFLIASINNILIIYFTDLYDSILSILNQKSNKGIYLIYFLVIIFSYINLIYYEYKNNKVNK